MKVAATIAEFEATVKKIYGDHPTNPTRYELVVVRDDGVEERVAQHHVVAVIEKENA
jgi:hypothetical protein